jgi:hypothetical protein
MAGDWLKVETCTPDKPEVWVIAEELELDPDAVFGKIFRVWVWFDLQTERGNAPNVTKKLLNRLVGVTGFCESVINAGWMIEQDGIVSIPNFERHNGESAKKRALTAKRVAKYKQKKGNASSVTPALPREEKRRGLKEVGGTTPIPHKKTKATQKMAKPTIGEISTYCTERKNQISAQRFFDHYESNGWRVGKNPMKNWQAAIRTWEQSDIARQKAGDGGDVQRISGDGF